MADWRAKQESPTSALGQAELYPLRLQAILDEPTNGQHLHLIGEAAGSKYFCKRDSDGTPVRATEFFCSSLVAHLGILVPNFALIENPETGEVLFGSKGIWGIAADFEVQTFLTTPIPVNKAVSGNFSWLASHLSRLYAVDMFLGNPDRQLRNFLLAESRLLAFDFASARLENLSSSIFPIAKDKTVSVGRFLRSVHGGFDLASADEIIKRIAAVPVSEIEAILSKIPEDWLTEREKGKLCESWVNGAVGDRLAALRRGLSDGSLL